MGCYGDPLARTPHVDALAAKGMCFRRVWSCVPSCAAGAHRDHLGSVPVEHAAVCTCVRWCRCRPRSSCIRSSCVRRGTTARTTARKTTTAASRQVCGTNPPTRHTGGIVARGSRSSPSSTSTKSHESQIRTRPHQQITDPAASPRAGLSSGYSGSASGLGAVLRQGQRGRCGCRRTVAGARAGRPGARHDRVLLRGPRQRHAALQTLCRATPGCTCRWSSTSRRSGGTWPRRTTDRAATRTAWSALWILRRRC